MVARSRVDEKGAASTRLRTCFSLKLFTHILVPSSRLQVLGAMFASVGYEREAHSRVDEKHGGDGAEEEVDSSSRYTAFCMYHGMRSGRMVRKSHGLAGVSCEKDLGVRVGRIWALTVG